MPRADDPMDQTRPKRRESFVDTSPEVPSESAAFPRQETPLRALGAAGRWSRWALEPLGAGAAGRWSRWALEPLPDAHCRRHVTYDY